MAYMIIIFERDGRHDGSVIFSFLKQTNKNRILSKKTDFFKGQYYKIEMFYGSRT